jgi:hypothetical protein
MFKLCKILNKITNQTFLGQIDTILQQLPEYELVEIPDDGKVYVPSKEPPYYTEKTPTLEESKLIMLEIIANLKKAPFSVAITDINNVEGSYYITLEDSTILKVLVLVKKAEILGQASDEFINAQTGTPEYKTFTLAEIQQVQAQVITNDDFLKLKANQVKNAQMIEDLQAIELELEE